MMPVFSCLDDFDIDMETIICSLSFKDITRVRVAVKDDEDDKDRLYSQYYQARGSCEFKMPLLRNRRCMRLS